MIGRLFGIEKEIDKLEPEEKSKDTTGKIETSSRGILQMV